MRPLNHFDDILAKNIDIKPEFQKCRVTLKDDWVVLQDTDGNPIWSCHKEAAFVEEILTVLGLDWCRYESG